MGSTGRFIKSFNHGMKSLYIIKIGGNIIDDAAALSNFLMVFARLDAPKILVHGGGKLATQLAETLRLPQMMIEGRRITDAESLKVVTMVYAGYINKNIVAQLQGYSCNALGICGADGNLIQAHKRQHPTIDYGFVGDVDKVNTNLISQLLQVHDAIVAAPITHDGKGQLLNTNADTIAASIAQAMSSSYRTSLVYSFEKSGVLLDAADDTTVIPQLTPALYAQLKAEQKIFAGMIPKLDNAFTAIRSGVHKVIIGNAAQLPQLVQGSSGTTISNE